VAKAVTLEGDESGGRREDIGVVSRGTFHAVPGFRSNPRWCKASAKGGANAGSGVHKSEIGVTVRPVKLILTERSSSRGKPCQGRKSKQAPKIRKTGPAEQGEEPRGKKTPTVNVVVLRRRTAGRSTRKSRKNGKGRGIGKEHHKKAGTIIKRREPKQHEESQGWEEKAKGDEKVIQQIPGRLERESKKGGVETAPGQEPQ